MHATFRSAAARSPFAALTAALLTVLAACGGGEGDADPSTSGLAVAPDGRVQALAAGHAEVQKFGAPNGMAGDLFGYAIAPLGTSVVVGAPQESPQAGISENTGKAYLFDGSGTLVRELRPTSANERRRDDGYGRSVAASDNIIAIGSPGADDNGNFAGEVFLLNAQTGGQLAKLAPTGTRRNPADGSGFGSAVGVSADRIVVGAPGTFANARTSTGAVYLYEAATRRLITRVIPPGARSIDNIGSAVAVAGNTVVAGAPFDDTGARDAGAVYVLNAVDGTLRFKLTAPDAAASDVFGSAVSTNDALVAVGAQQDDDLGVNSGAVYLFSAVTGAFVRKIMPADGGPNDLFGVSVSLVGGRLAVGAWGDNYGAGSVYVFDALTGAQLGKFEASDAAPPDILGRSVALSGTDVIAGAPRDADQGLDSGAVYRFGLTTP